MGSFGKKAIGAHADKRLFDIFLDASDSRRNTSIKAIIGIYRWKNLKKMDLLFRQ